MFRRSGGERSQDPTGFSQHLGYEPSFGPKIAWRAQESPSWRGLSFARKDSSLVHLSQQVGRKSHEFDFNYCMFAPFDVFHKHRGPIRPPSERESDEARRALVNIRQETECKECASDVLPDQYRAARCHRENLSRQGPALDRRASAHALNDRISR